MTIHIDLSIYTPFCSTNFTHNKDQEKGQMATISYFLLALFLSNSHGLIATPVAQVVGGGGSFLNHNLAPLVSGVVTKKDVPGGSDPIHHKVVPGQGTPAPPSDMHELHMSNHKAAPRVVPSQSDLLYSSVDVGGLDTTSLPSVSSVRTRTLVPPSGPSNGHNKGGPGDNNTPTPPSSDVIGIGRS
ncbi:hypothetical protein GUJ93_ZPchr0005g15353 [Zizania palustris]|uniref:Uncharacterized protein n=1 Tax=Zizania palustris TaxID=103762 RepID=A0A8J5SAA9_ZIZPA|nr:hypothetical protein GUJ93_ZPchr0005g15353 [Zizania palustris]